MKITFKTEWKDAIEHLPFPIKKTMPEWYKKIPSFVSADRDHRSVKMCMPFQDALISGYCIPLPMDLRLKKEYDDKGELMLKVIWGNNHHTLWGDNHNIVASTMAIEGHHKGQYGGMPIPEGAMSQVIKINMPYRIFTPSGYSCLFIPPMNRERKYFEIISGIIDTDNYGGVTNLPSFIMDWTEDQNGHDSLMIPGGTPIAQVFPFKRDKWELEVVEDDWNKNKWFMKYFTKWANNYKIKSWKKKEYK